MSHASWMESRANESSYSVDCNERCEGSVKAGRLYEIETGIQEAVQRGLHMPLSVLAERDSLLIWLKENSECTC